MKQRMANITFEDEPLTKVVDREEIAKESKRGRSSRKLWYAFGGGTLAIAAISVGAWLHFAGHVSTDDAQIDGHIIPIASKIYGTVAQVLINDNQRVKAGDVLVKIDARDYQVRVDQALAALAYAESQARAASAGVPVARGTTSGGASEALAQLRGAEADVAKAQAEYQRSSTAELAGSQANVQAAEAQAEKAQADLNRMKPLVDKEEISRQQYDSYVAAARVAESQLRAAREQYDAARQNIGTRQASLLSAQARVAEAQAGLQSSQASQGQVNVRAAEASSAVAAIGQARANLEAAQLQLGYATITAPMNGVVTKKSVEPGQIVQQGQGLMTIVPDEVWVTANFKETQLGDVRVGQKAEIKVAVNGAVLQVHVDSIAGATGARLSLLPPENATGNFVKVVQRVPLKIVLDHVPENTLVRPGMNVDATIITK
jgi:membrane fusion protein, multidrug efflux system